MSLLDVLNLMDGDKEAEGESPNVERKEQLVTECQYLNVFDEIAYWRHVDNFDVERNEKSRLDEDTIGH